MPVWDVIDTPHEQSNVFRAAGILCSPPLLISANNNDHRHCAIKIGHMKRDIPTLEVTSRAYLAGIPHSVGPRIAGSVDPNHHRPKHAYPGSVPNHHRAVDPDCSEDGRMGSESGSYPPYTGEYGWMGSTCCWDCGLPHDGHHLSHNRSHPHEEMETGPSKRRHAIQGTLG